MAQAPLARWNGNTMRRAGRRLLGSSRPAGLVANQRINVRRSEFDRLKATLTNCIRVGPESQNRNALQHFRSHLEGRVGFVEMINSARGKRLHLIFERIQWQ